MISWKREVSIAEVPKVTPIFASRVIEVGRRVGSQQTTWFQISSFLSPVNMAFIPRYVLNFHYVITVLTSAVFYIPVRLSDYSNFSTKAL